SKSLGNFFTIRDITKSWDGESLRHFLLSTHYRNPINYSQEALQEADKRVEYFYETMLKASGWLSQKKFTEKGALQNGPVEAFRRAMEDDFNTAEALAVLGGVLGQLNARIDAKAPPAEVAGLQATARELSAALGLLARDPAEAVRGRRQIAARRRGIEPAWVEERISARLQARKSKDYAAADAIRAEVAGKGVELRDGPQGTDWRVLL